MLLTSIAPDCNNPMCSHFRGQFPSGDFSPIHPEWTQSLKSEWFIFSQSILCQQENSTGLMMCSFHAWSFLYCLTRHFWGRDSPGTVHDGSLASCTSTALQQLALLSNEPNLHPFLEGPCLNLEEGRWQWAFTQMLYLSIWSDMHLILAKS